MDFFSKTFKNYALSTLKCLINFLLKNTFSTAYKSCDIHTTSRETFNAMVNITLSPVKLKLVLHKFLLVTISKGRHS